jgi:lipoprotein-anchoring transpeptidase ErfK/SrfK
VRLTARLHYRHPASLAGGVIYRLLAVAGLAFLAWVWWQSGKSSTPPVSPTTIKPSPLSLSKSAAPVLPTNPPPMVVITSPPPSVVLPVTNASPGTTLVATNPPPPRTNVARAEFSGRPVQNVFEAQLALTRLGISAGSLDGAIGSQTRAALRAYQQREHLPVTGELDASTKAALPLSVPPYTTYTVTAGDLARLQPLSSTWLGKSQQSALDYETILELVAEKGHAHPGFIKRLNPGIDWTNVVEGATVQLPNAALPRARTRAAFVVIHLAAKNLQAFDANTNLLAHFPCSIAQRVEKRPVGELHVAVLAPNPNYTFNPEVFPESAEARELNRKLILPAGPNNPVGVAWIGLDKPGYGIHGTPSPEAVGRTESHGCFRLANWNAEYLIRLVSIGMPVYVE